MITSDINLAIESLKKGNVIAIPTETVYGLGDLLKNQVLIRF